MQIENVGEYLKKNGIKPSIQRMRIFQYLMDNHTHPTVDDIFQNLSPEMPTLSKTTVYNTLNTFVRSNIIQEIIIEENEVRYDVVTENHGHFKCKTCGEIMDFDVDLSKIDLSKFKNYFVIPFVFLIPIAVFLVKVQNHASAAIIVTAVVIIITIMSQIKMSDLVKELGILIALISGGFIIFKDTIIKGFRGNRLAAWLHTWEGDNPIKISYQTVQSLYAISAGGLFGVGLGKSKQKYLYIPEAHNDFIFAIIAEELGLIGAIVVIALFVAFAIRGYLIVARVKDRFSKLVATGITSLIILQAFLNIGVVTNTIPNTGISLPFLSYGNTSLIILLGSVGILLGISRNAKVEEKTEAIRT